MNRHKYKNAKPKLDDRKDMQLPLDYSFKTLSSFDDCLKEKQRSRETSSSVQDLDEEVVLEDAVEIIQSNSTALKVNNNMLTSWDNFSDTIHRLFVDPALTLSWIDLSFNDLRSIDEALLELPNLMMIYLHGNNIYTLSNVDKLSSLRKLKSLTLHGNPVEGSPGYRCYVVSIVSQLQTFDFSGVTKEERATAETWWRMNSKKPKARRKLQSETQ